MRKLTFFLLFGAFCALPLAGQQAENTQQRYFFKDHITLTTGTLLREPARHTSAPIPDDRTPNIEGLWGKGLRLGILYTLNLGPRAGVETGLIPATFRERYLVNIPGSQVNGSRSVSAHTLLEIPIRVFYRARLSEKIFFQPAAGISLVSYSRKECTGAYYEYDSQYNPVYSSFQRINTAENTSLFTYWTLKTSFGFILPNENILHAGISAQLLMAGEERYTTRSEYIIIHDPALTTQGNLDTRGHYLALDIGYTFTRTRELKRDLERIGGSLPATP